MRAALHKSCGQHTRRVKQPGALFRPRHFHHRAAIRNAAQDIQAQVSAWQGSRINVLTIVTMIFLPISFLTGYFGMNFTWLENQLDSFWMWMLLGVALPILLVVAGVLLLASGGYTVPKLLKRKDRAPSS